MSRQLSALESCARRMPPIHSRDMTPKRLNSRQSTSRQSVISSSLSIVTGVSEIDTGKENEALFPKRWEAETEMNKRLNLLKRKNAATIRLMKIHDVHNRLLQDKIKLLNTNFSSIEKELNKETKCLKEEMAEYTPNWAYKPKRESYLPKIESATPQDATRSSSRTSVCNQYSYDQTQQDICRSCMFDSSNSKTRCLHFPCFLPETYNSLGLMHKSTTYSVLGKYRLLLQRCRDLRPPTSQMQLRERAKKMNDDASTESRAPRTTIKEKIRGLKQLIKEMKEQNKRKKPKDWATNYGEPMPLRIILKPVKIADH